MRDLVVRARPDVLRLFSEVGPDGSAAPRLVEQLCELSAAGIEHVYGMVVGQHLITAIEAMGTDVIPAVADW